MSSKEKQVQYCSHNSYSTLNALSNTTKAVWFVCHGMGYLSRYFLNYFKGLPKEEHYIIAPQAPNKYYQQPKMYVGANWLTRDNTLEGTSNIINYFDAIFELERIPKHTNIIVFGYSQGVSVALRYMAKRQLQCSQLVIHSGGIPNELDAKDFYYLNPSTKVKLVYGTEDEYLDAPRIENEIFRAKDIFGKRLQIFPFEGKHIVNVEFIKTMI